MLKNIEIALRRILLKLLLMFSKKKSADKLNLKPGDDVLVIRLNRIGDGLVTTPLIKVLAESGGFNVYVLADKKNKIVFENNRFIKGIIVFEKGLKGLKKTLREINKRNFKLVIDSHIDISTTVSFLIAGLKTFTISLDKGNGSLYSVTVPPLPEEKYHVVERVLHIADYLNIEYSKENINIIYFPREESLLAVRKEIEKINPEHKFLLGINISAGSDARFWGIENYRRLIKSIERFDIVKIIFCTPWERERAENISLGRVPILAGSFDLFAAEISKLDLLFSPDTSAVHLASAFKVPVFGIYVLYNTTEKEWYPYRSEHRLAITKEPDIKSLKFEEVEKIFIDFLSKFVR